MCPQLMEKAVIANPNGYTIYKGPSMLDGEDIVVPAAGFYWPSRNEKTGPLIQTYILRQDISPVEAMLTGQDKSICGNCDMRGDGHGKDRPCYVQLHRGPRIVYNHWKGGGYPACAPERLPLRGRSVRLGAYGDPAAVPVPVWLNTLKLTGSWSGYTGQWRDFPELAAFCMASVTSMDEREEAKSLGWRTYRVRLDSEPVGDGELICPGSKEGGRKTQCVRCRLCSGNAHKLAKDVTSIAHGAGKPAFERMVARRAVIPIQEMINA